MIVPKPKEKLAKDISETMLIARSVQRLYNYLTKLPYQIIRSTSQKFKQSQKKTIDVCMAPFQE